MTLQAVRPKILGFISEQASAWLVALVVLLAGCTLTIIVAWAAADVYQQQVHQRFQLLVNERYARLQNVLKTRSNAWQACNVFSPIPVMSPAPNLMVSPNPCCCAPAPMPGRHAYGAINAAHLSRKFPASEAYPS